MYGASPNCPILTRKPALTLPEPQKSYKIYMKNKKKSVKTLNGLFKVWHILSATRGRVLTHENRVS
jgi:hypothetical protein